MISNDQAMAKIACSYCQCPVNSVRIHCTECPAPDEIDLCLQCFCCGAEIGGHRKDHGYQLLDSQDFQIFDSPIQWTANEELMLLDAVEQYGFGNWGDISSHVESKTSEECVDHYNSLFILGNIGRATFPEETIDKVKDHTSQDGPLSPALPQVQPAIELSVVEQHELGYMPLRDDFEREYDNEAEAEISSLDVTHEDDDLDTVFKLAQVDIYRQRIKERVRRKKISRTHALIMNVLKSTKQNLKGTKRKMSKEEKDLQEKMRIFAQFQTSAEREQYFETLQKERQTKLRIKELMRFRRNGITKLEDCKEFEEEKYLREKKKENRKKMGNLALKRTSMVSKKASEEKHDTSGRKESDGQDGDKMVLRDPTTLPSYSLLTDTERKLCNSIGLKPAHYITIKTCIIKDYLQRRQGVPIKVRYPSGLDKSHRQKIINFLSDNGWIGVT
ncbi:transcriptional adapter 2-beta-like [Lineus longissimus]|uniref:transcriptional adapter 2-beta-like n=1 Tax=Lineus longissimus TaxID=88925 RepID=UPI002B4E2240